MTESKYKAIKMLLNGGATCKESADYMGVSSATVYRVRETQSWMEYTNMMAENTLAARKEREAKRNAKEKKKEPETEPVTQVVEHRQTVTVQATWQMTQEMQKTNKLLEQISSKLAFIVDELTGVNSNAKPDN